MLNFDPQIKFAPEDGGNGGGVNPKVEDTVAGVADSAKELVELSPEVQADIESRRTAWSKLANELNIDESQVSVTNTGIKIRGVATFNLNDDESATYNELVKGEKGGEKGVPKNKIWENFSSFMKNWSSTQQDTFLAQVMGMYTTKEGDRNFYLAASPYYTNSVCGFEFSRGGVCYTNGLSKGYLFRVRRVQD